MKSIRMAQFLLPFAVVAAVTLPVRAQEAVLSDQILPGDTYLHFTVKSVEDAKRQFVESPFGQLINDPAMDEFRAELERAFAGRLQEGFAKVEDQLGVPVEELLQIPSGEVSVSIAGAGNHVGLVIRIDYGDSESQVMALMDLATEALSAVTELNQVVDEVDGTEITMYEVVEDVPTPLIKEFGWFTRDNHLVISSSRNVMESLIANWAGDSSETLANNETYNYVVSRLESEPGAAASILYADPIGLAQKLVQTSSFGQGQMIAGMVVSQLPMLGFNQLKAVGAVFEDASGDFQMTQRAMVYAEQPPAGLMRMFMLEPVSPVPPEWVKEDAVMYTAVHWNIGEAYSAIESLVDGFQGTGTLDALLKQASAAGPGVDIKSDLIEQLTGELHMAGGGIDAENATNEMLFAIGVQDASTFGDLLARVSNDPQFPGSIREFREFTLYEIAEAGPPIGFTVAHGYFLVAIGGTVMEQVLRNDDDIRPLAETEEFQRISQHFPSEVVSVSFSRPAEQYRSMYELIQSGNAAEQFPGMDEVFAEIDFSTLPPFEVISQYLTPAGSFSVNDENGLISEAFSLKP